MSTLVIDTLQGKTTAGSVNVRGEGSTNTNLQQGLAKAWGNLDGTGTIAFRDSFNCSGITDLGTGQATVAYSNSFSNDDYSAVQYNNASNVITSYNNHFAGGLDNRTSSQTRLACNNGSAAVDAHLCDIQISGDLA